MTTLRAKLLAAALGTIAIAAPLQAHRLWMLPSTTIVSGDDDWITFDAAASNDLFFPDHQPLRAEPAVVQPDGTPGKVEHMNIGQYRATFDLHMAQKGTYKLVVQNGGVMGSFKVGGVEQRLPRGTKAEQLATAIPAGATDVKLAESINRNEVFVTAGAPTQTALKPTGIGLELVPVTHPNDLVAGEPATFRFTADGKPAAKLTVTVIAGGSRYRHSVDEKTFTTDAQGQVAITWPAAGMYWINASATAPSVAIPNAEKRLSYTAVLEVLQP
ncbi:MAG: DUF4198 domain-containing protein [Pseudomonadota bacterium]